MPLFTLDTPDKLQYHYTTNLCVFYEDLSLLSRGC